MTDVKEVKNLNSVFYTALWLLLLRGVVAFIFDIIYVVESVF